MAMQAPCASDCSVGVTGSSRARSCRAQCAQGLRGLNGYYLITIADPRAGGLRASQCRSCPANSSAASASGAETSNSRKAETLLRLRALARKPNRAASRGSANTWFSEKNRRQPQKKPRRPLVRYKTIFDFGGIDTGMKKLLVVAGAGSSINFGMPSGNGVHEFLLRTAGTYFPLAADPSRNLYGFLFDKIKKYWAANTNARLGKEPNFEDVFYAIYALASCYPAGIFTGSLGAFVSVKQFPDVTYIGNTKPFDKNILSHLGQELVDA
jgi:hypothetical protein